MSTEDLDAKLRKVALLERLDKSRGFIGKMCSEGRPPKMRIPVHWDDEDHWISATAKDAAQEIVALREERDALRLLLADIMDDATGDARDEEKRTWPLRIDNWRKGRALLDSSNKEQ